MRARGTTCPQLISGRPCHPRGAGRGSLRVHIECFRPTETESGGIAYEMDLSDGMYCWRVRRRYNEFLRCHKVLVKSGAMPRSDLPPFPCKEPMCQQIFGRERTRQRWSFTRACQLHHYLSRLLENQAAMQASAVHDLLGFIRDQAHTRGASPRASSPTNASSDDLEAFRTRNSLSSISPSVGESAALKGLRARPTDIEGEIEVEVQIEPTESSPSSSSTLDVSVSLRQVGSDAASHIPCSGSGFTLMSRTLKMLFVFPPGSTQATQRIIVGKGTSWLMSAITKGEDGAWSDPLEVLVLVPTDNLVDETLSESTVDRASAWRRSIQLLVVMTAALALAVPCLRATELKDLSHILGTALCLSAALSSRLLVAAWRVCHRGQEDGGQQASGVMCCSAESDNQPQLAHGRRRSPQEIAAMQQSIDINLSEVGLVEVTEMPILEPVFLGFRKLALAQELRVQHLLDVAESFLDVLKAMGRAMKFGVIDFVNNTRKVRDWYLVDTRGHDTFQMFLEAEKATGIHQRNGVLKDPSGAIGALWLRRTFEFVVGICEQLVDGASMQGAAQTAYANNLEPFHGRMLRSSFYVLLKGVPSRQAFLQSLNLEEEVIMRTLSALCTVTRNVCSKMKAMSISLDLEDTRRV